MDTSKVSRLRAGLVFAVLAVLVLMLAAAAAGCKAEAPADSQQAQEETAQDGAITPPVSKDGPLKVDDAAKTVTVYAEVNGKYLHEPTRHGVVFKDGSNGDKSVFKAWADPLEFHDVLKQIGAEPGDNVTADSPEGTIVEGDSLDVRVTVAETGDEYEFADLIESEPDKGFDIRFGGNRDFQSEVKTGCIVCLDSCAAGITSNAAWGWKSFDTGKVEFTGDPEVLEDGQAVAITFAVK